MPATRLHRFVLDRSSYERSRARLRQRVIELRRPRRLSLGPVTVIFECCDTVLFQIHEVLRAEGDWSPERCRRELHEYACLVPGRGEIGATLLISGGPPAAGAAIIDALSAGEPHVSLELDGVATTAELAAPTLSRHNPVQYVRFRVGEVEPTAARVELRGHGARRGRGLGPALARILAAREPALFGYGQASPLQLQSPSGQSIEQVEPATQL